MGSDSKRTKTIRARKKTKQGKVRKALSKNHGTTLPKEKLFLED